MSLAQKIEFLKKRKGLFALADQMVHSGTTFLTGILVGRLLSVGEFGEFSLGLTLVVFSMVLQDNCLATPYTYRFHNNSDESKEGLRAGALIQSLMLALICTSLLFVAYFILPSEGYQDLRNILFVLSCSMPFLFIRETSRRIYFTEFRLIDTFIMDVIVSALQILLIIGLWYVNWISTSSVFFAMALAAFIGSAGAFIFHRKDFDFKLADIKKDTIENIHFGKWLLAGSFCHLGSLYIFPWLIYAMIGDVKAGAFAACYTLVNLINPFILGFNNYFRPHIMQTYSKEGLEAMHAQVMRMTMCFIPVAALISFLLVVFGGNLVQFIYGDDFINLGTIIAFVGISVIPVILNAPIQLATLAMNKPQINPKFHSAAFASTMCIGVPLVIFYDIIGAAIGYSLSVSIGFIALIYFYRKELVKLRVENDAKE